MTKWFRKTLGVLISLTLLFAYSNMPVLAAGDVKPSNDVLAIPTTSAVLVNGTPVSFQAFNINGNNYFKLRDLGKALSGTAKQFEISYDNINNAISMTTGKQYTPVGGELTTNGNTAEQTAVLSSASVYINGSKADLTAYTINGYNYYKLRDIATVLDFGVTFNNNTIGIDTSTGYESDTHKDINLTGSWRLEMTTNNKKYISYLIFSEDGTLTQFIGQEVATYKVENDKKITIKQNFDGSTTSHSYSLYTENNQTVFFVDAKQFQKMVRDGVSPDLGASTIPGLWISLTGFFNSSTYYFFTKDGSILFGVIETGKFTISADGSSFSDNITEDGSYETTKFTIEIVDGIEVMTATDSEGNKTTLTKE